MVHLCIVYIPLRQLNFQTTFPKSKPKVVARKHLFLVLCGLPTEKTAVAEM